ncbi:uncharacterized protein LOC133796584 isoform X1 [Humulus lupulus]|uniref:uncharacterized protein LOC133796584 isoform X1 n=2 Tax=Humulus lupulus TaxID=3486 RepID=UPI002B40BF10|nr:uncharacterized protein LOC133796584 isoform X1 [Humulus lupulus]
MLRLFMPMTPATATANATTSSIIAFSSTSPSSSDFFTKSSRPFHSLCPNFIFSFSSYSSIPPRKKPPHISPRTWLRRHARRDIDSQDMTYEEKNDVRMFGSDEEVGSQIPTQAQSVVEGSGAVLVSEFKPAPDVDYLQELLAIQQQGPRAIGFFGTRNMGFMHQELIEILSYAMVITKNHIYTSGASGTNAAVIRGALRAEKPELLTVILPQSLKKQPPESQELLSKVKNVIEKPYNDHLPLIEASRLCNMDIISQVQQVICFAFHDSRLLMETCQEAKNLRKIVTLFYLD